MKYYDRMKIDETVCHGKKIDSFPSAINAGRVFDMIQYTYKEMIHSNKCCFRSMASLQNDDLTFIVECWACILYVVCNILSDDQTPLIFDSIKRISACLETIRIEQGFRSFMRNMQKNNFWPFIFTKWIKYGCAISLVKISTNENRRKEEKM